MTTFNIIVAVDSKNGIGKDGKLPWHLPQDLTHFKEITIRTSSVSKQNGVIMGRKTWDSIPENFRPLKGRVNVLLSRNQKLPVPEGVIVSSGFEEAIKSLEDNDSVEDIFVIGGGEVFRSALKDPRCRTIYLTKIEEDFQCDTFFPSFETLFKKVSSSQACPKEVLTYSFFKYLRKE